MIDWSKLMVPWESVEDDFGFEVCGIWSKGTFKTALFMVNRLSPQPISPFTEESIRTSVHTILKLSRSGRIIIRQNKSRLLSEPTFHSFLDLPTISSTSFEHLCQGWGRHSCLGMFVLFMLGLSKLIKSSLPLTSIIENSYILTFGPSTSSQFSR